MERGNMLKIIFFFFDFFLKSKDCFEGGEYVCINVEFCLY